MTQQPATRPGGGHPDPSTAGDPANAPGRAVARQRSTAKSTTSRVPWRVAGGAAALAAALNLLAYLIGEAATGGLRAPMGPGGTLTELPVVAVVLVSVVGTLVAAVALRLVQRLLPRRALGTWLGLVAAGLLVSLAPMAQVPAESVPWLVTMHVVVAVVAVLVLGRRARRA